MEVTEAHCCPPVYTLADGRSRLTGVVGGATKIDVSETANVIYVVEVVRELGLMVQERSNEYLPQFPGETSLTSALHPSKGSCSIKREQY